MYQIEYPFVAVAWPMQNKVTIANLAEKDQPHQVIHTDGPFMSFFGLNQFGDAIRLAWVCLVDGKLKLTRISVPDYNEKKQVTFRISTEDIDEHFEGLKEKLGDISFL